MAAFSCLRCQSLGQRLLSVMHTMRYHAHYKTSGTGHLYQGRVKSFPIHSDEHLLIAMRYVES